MTAVPPPARLPMTVAVTAALVAVLAGCAASADAESRTPTSAPPSTPASMSCTDTKAANDRINAKLETKHGDPVLLREGTSLILDHPSCFTPALVDGARLLMKDLDQGIVPTLPTFTAPSDPGSGR